MEKTTHPYDVFFDQLKPVLISKVEEFQLLGYEKIDIQDIWTYLVNKKWKKHKEDIRTYELVSDIFSLKIGEFMNYMAIEAIKTSNWLEDLSSDEMQELLEGFSPKDD